jgi:hypothetical protein
MFENEAIIVEQHLRYIREELDELRKDLRDVSNRIGSLVSKCADASRQSLPSDDRIPYVDNISIVPK